MPFPCTPGASLEVEAVRHDALFPGRVPRAFRGAEGAEGCVPYFRPLVSTSEPNPGSMVWC